MITVSRLAHRGAQAVVAVGLVLAGLSLGTASAATNVITVNSAADTATPGDRQCTLREAIANANSNSDTTNKDCKPGKPGMDVITFKIAGPAPHTIAIGSDLPAITDTLTIDGTTQPANKGAVAKTVCGTGANGSPAMSPRIELEFNSPGTAAFNVAADASIIRGLAINHAGNGVIYGIEVSNGFSTRIECNAFGVTATNTAPALTWFNDILIDGGSTAAVTIGTNGDGFNDANEGNTFNGAVYAIDINGNTLTTIAGNTFGLGLDGKTSMPNTTGVYFRQGSYRTRIGTNGDGLSDSLERNVFGPNTTGVDVETFTGNDNHSLIAGNWFGADVTGAAAPISVGVKVGDGTNQLIGFSHGDLDGSIVADNRRNAFVSATTAGIQVMASADLVGIGGNTFGTMPIGVDFGGAALDPASGYNCFETAATAVRNTTAVNISLQYSWWNAGDGPSGDGAGTGDIVSHTGTGTVDFSNFATSGMMCLNPSSAAGPKATAPALATPVAVNKTTTMVWSKVAGATGYYLLVDVNPDFSSALSIFVTSPSMKLSQSSYGRYFWKAMASFGPSTTQWSEARYYDVTLMTAPRNLTKMRSDKVKFSWKADKTIADSYRIEIASGPYFGPTIAYQNTGSALTFTQVLPTGRWYWRVVLINGGVDQVTLPAWIVTVP